MLIRRARSLAVFGVLAALVVVSSAAMAASSSRRAEALCAGVNTPWTITHVDASGNVVAREAAPFPFTTCDGDAQYTGILQDSITDGSCTYAYYLEPLAFYGLEATECTTGAWAQYGYSDTIGTNNVFVSARPSYLPDEWKLSYGY